MFKYGYHPVYRQPYGILRIIGWVLLGILAVGGFAFLFGYVVMLLWNWLMPAVFGLSTVTFWQAVAIVILGKIIFSGFGHGSPRSRNHRPDRFFRERIRPGHRHEDWKYYYKFWKDEGEEAFKEYIEKKKSEETTDDNSQE